MNYAAPAKRPERVTCVHCGRLIHYGALRDSVGTGWVHTASGQQECADTLPVDGL